VFYLLREMGFPEGTVFNSFLYRTSDGKHHMFTLWFEDRENPWIIDSTGAMSSEAIRSSDLTGWRPLRTFSLAESYTVERRRRGIF